MTGTFDPAVHPRAAGGQFTETLRADPGDLPLEMDAVLDDIAAWAERAARPALIHGVGYTRSRQLWRTVHNEAPALLDRAVTAGTIRRTHPDLADAADTWQTLHRQLVAADAPAGVVGESVWGARRLLLAYHKAAAGQPYQVPAPDVAVCEQWLAGHTS